MDIQTKAAAIRANISNIIIGKSAEIDLVLTALLANGHVLLEDVPGTGKTQLAKALAKSLNCEYNRIQFTPDLLPSDLTGINFYSPATGEFAFRKGSLFTHVLLGDEINRATPRTQSGLLESMEERQITVDGTTYPLEMPYFVIATQNPVETQGTFPLPEAQLDRFLIKLSIGYPQKAETVDIVQRYIKADPLAAIGPVCGRSDIIEMQNRVREVFMHPDVGGYIVSLAEETRGHDAVTLGVSTRGCLALARAAQAYAAINGRDYITPDDVKYLLPYVFIHRMILRGSPGSQASRVKQVLEEIMAAVPAPTEDWDKTRNYYSGS
jgi:MoxR-like ATPase